MRPGRNSKNTLCAVCKKMETFDHPTTHTEEEHEAARAAVRPKGTPRTRPAFAIAERNKRPPTPELAADDESADKTVDENTDDTDETRK